MSRRIGVNTWVWCSPLTDDALAALVPKIAGLGFAAVELPLEQLGDWDAARTNDLLAEHDLTPVVIGAMGAGRSLIARAGDVDATVAYLRACLAAAHRLDAQVVAGPFYAPTGATWRMSAEERVAIEQELRANLAPLVDAAAAVGVRLAIEPLNRYETSVLNTVDQALEALGPLIGPGLGLALDTYHLNIEERRPEQAIRVAGEAGALAHVQVCGSDRGPVGGDHTDWEGVVDALDAVGYDGVVGLESFTAANETIAVAASVWRPLAETQDALAARSIRMLRALEI